MIRGRIGDGDPASLRKVFNKFKKDELEGLVGSLGVEFEVDDRFAKSKIIETLIQTHYKRGLSYDTLAQIDLIHAQAHPTLRKWKALRLINGTETAPVQSVSDPAELIGTLSAKMRVFFEHHIGFRKKDDFIWMRFYICDKGKHDARTVLAPGNLVYVVLHPISSVFLSTAMRLEHRDCLLQCVCAARGGTEVREMQLTGTTVDDMFELILNQHAQGPYSAFRMGEFNSNPLERVVKRKEEKKPDKYEEHPDIVVEDATLLRDLDDANEETFGHYPQPKMQKVEFKLETRFLGDDELNVPGRFMCKVKFEGPSVIDGIKELVPLGIAAVPLPPFLANLHSAAKNHFVLRDCADGNGVEEA